MTAPASVTVVGKRAATVRVDIDDVEGAFSRCHWLTCDATVSVQIYDPSGQQMGIDLVSNGVEERSLDEELVVPVKLIASVYALPDDTYSVKVTTNALPNFVTGDLPVVTTANTTFALTHVAEAKLSLGRAVSAYKRHGWKIVGELKKDGRLWSRAKVTLQLNVDPLGWRDVLTKSTNSDGQVTFTSNPDRRSGRWPARLVATGPNGERVVSRTFAIYRR